MTPGPREQTPAQAARAQRKKAKLGVKHCVRKLRAAARVRMMLHEWHWRAIRRLVVRYSNGALTGDGWLELPRRAARTWWWCRAGTSGAAMRWRRACAIGWRSEVRRPSARTPGCG